MHTADTEAQAIRLQLAYKPPYDWSAMLGFLAARAIPGVEAATPDTYSRSICLAGEYGTLSVRHASVAEAPHALLATIRFPSRQALPAIEDRLRRIFDLGTDPAVIGEHLAQDPLLAGRVRARPGLRVPGAWDGYELAVRAVLGQQISVAAATRLAGKLVAAFGSPLPAPCGVAVAGVTHYFPPPQLLAGADVALALGMPRARGRAIAAVAAAAMASPQIFEPGLALETALARLKEIAGIGDWTANYIAMRALREPDAFPAADIGLLRALDTGAGRPTPIQLLERAQAWRPWRAYAALHLWTVGPFDAD